MLNIETYQLGQLQANCYLISRGKDCLLIDPGDGADFILEQLARRSFVLKAVLVTHGHFDHIMAAGEIQLSAKVPLMIDEKDFFLVKRLKESAKHFLDFEPEVVSPSPVVFLKERKYSLGFAKFEVIATPGHTPGGVCFYFPKEKAVFTGDTLFKNAVGRTDFSYGKKTDLERSLLRLFELPEDTVIYPGHGEKTSVLAERKNFIGIF